MSDATAPQPPVKTAWLIGTLAAFALFAVVAIYSSRMTWDYPNYDKLRAADRLDTLHKLQADESKMLNGPADWIDQGKGVVHLPIDEAMNLEIDTLKSKPAQIGAEIPAAAPATPVAPVNAKAPASGATNAAPAAATPPPAKGKK